MRPLKSVFGLDQRAGMQQRSMPVWLRGETGVDGRAASDATQCLLGRLTGSLGVKAFVEG
jgi:hypothetical protein